MSEAPTAPAKSGTVKLPGLGPVPKKWFLIVGGGSVVVIAYVLYKRKSGAAATTAAPTDTGTAALAGQPCVDANGNPGVYDDTGTCQTDTSALGGYYAGSGAQGVSGVTPPVPGTGGFTTNGQWTQQAETDMEALGIDPGTLAAALGAYITGQPLTTAQQSLVDQAIAMEGYPPVAGPGGYPPAMHTSPTGSSGPGTCASGFTFSAIQTGVTGEVAATGGTGWCEPAAVAQQGTCPSGYTFSATQTGASGEVAASGGTGWCEPASAGNGSGGGGTTLTKPATVTGLKAVSESKTSIALRWNGSAKATSYQVRVTYQTKVIQTHTVTGTSYTVTGLAANRTYGLHVVAIDSAGWAPEASIVQKTLS